jgi:hypothetical protein
VDAVVQAFDAALAKAVAQIVAWALTLPPPPATRSAADIAASEPSRATRPKDNISPQRAPGGNELKMPGSANPPAP